MVSKSGFYILLGVLILVTLIMIGLIITIFTMKQKKNESYMASHPRGSLNSLNFVLKGKKLPLRSDLPPGKDLLECLLKLHDSEPPYYTYVDGIIVIKVYNDRLTRLHPFSFEVAFSDEDTFSPIPLSCSYYHKDDRFTMQSVDKCDADQYASYFQYNVTESERQHKHFTIKGYGIENVNYISIQYITVIQIMHKDGSITNPLCFYKFVNYFTDLQDDDVIFFAKNQPVKNPFQFGNPNTACYGKNPVSELPTRISSNDHSQKLISSRSYSATPISAIPIYRLSKKTSSTDFVLEQQDLRTCSNTYLFCRPVNPEKSRQFDLKFYGILRIKVPNIYSPRMGCQTMDDYDALYFSISAMQRKQRPNITSFWTVNSPMMEKTKDEDGFAYVFWMPEDEFIGKFKLNSPTPPIIQWGDYTGYVLPTPTFAFEIRYKSPNPAWKGSPINAKCYLNEKTNKPVTSDELGEWLPSVYGQNFKNFDAFINSKSIGIIENSKEKPWIVSY